jgi:hypothetical protein
LKKLGPWKSQLEAQKKQITEVQSELEEERRRADKFELQFKNMLERNEALTQEKEVGYFKGKKAGYILFLSAIIIFYFLLFFLASLGRTRKIGRAQRRAAICAVKQWSHDDGWVSNYRRRYFRHDST